jgi:hypothetical protein
MIGVPQHVMFDFQMHSIGKETLVQTPSARDAHELLEANFTKGTILTWDCYAVNGVKTLIGLDVTHGDRIVSVSSSGAAVEIVCDRHIITVDLARTGRVIAHAHVQRWQHVPNRRPPTARLILSDGRGVDFVEPAKTKRITFTVVPTGLT